jgi:iron complex transport system substrate-binding protein
MRARNLLVLSLALLSLSLPFQSSSAIAQATPVPLTCAGTPTMAATAFPLAISDDAGREVVIAGLPERIISIAPSNTEILFALGLADRVVGVDNFSNYPPEATEKPQVGDYVDPDLEAIVAASPDLILATEVHVPTVLPKLETLGLPTVVVEPKNLDEVFTSIALVGQITGEPSTAQSLVCSLRARAVAVSGAIAGAPRPRVFFELSPDLYTAGPGSFVDDLLTRAGGENIAAGAAEMWPQLSTEALVSADPEVILLADHEAGVTAEQVAARPGWRGVSAVETGRIVSLDADLVARPGPRIVDGLEAIAAALHPGRVPEPGP